MRTLYGNTQYGVASRFLQEIPDELLAKPGESKQATALQRKLTTPNSKREEGKTLVIYRPGDKITHRKWGCGTIISVQGEGKNSSAKVAFPGLGIKELLLDLAPIDKIN